MTAVLSWRPDAVASADLAAGIKAARELNAVPVPGWLSKQLSNYILRVGRELEARDKAASQPAVNNTETPEKTSAVSSDHP